MYLAVSGSGVETVLQYMGVAGTVLRSGTEECAGGRGSKQCWGAWQDTKLGEEQDTGLEGGEETIFAGGAEFNAGRWGKRQCWRRGLR
jgi:hypothetical protein